MPHPAPIDPLLAVYAELAQRPPTRPSADQQRSLIYFDYEMSLIENRDATTSIPARVIQWTTTLHQLEDFVALYGRWPRENNRPTGSTITPKERRLATWVRTQRSATDQGRRCDYQLRRLACLPGYHARPLDDRWHDQFLDYQRFTLQHHRAPSLSSTDNAEKRLAAWAAKQRYAHRNRRLASPRLAALNRLPMWTWGN